MNWIPFATPVPAWWQPAYLLQGRRVLVLAWSPVWKKGDEKCELDPAEIVYLTHENRVGNHEDVKLDLP